MNVDSPCWSSKVFFFQAASNGSEFCCGKTIDNRILNCRERLLSCYKLIPCFACLIIGSIVWLGECSLCCKKTKSVAVQHIPPLPPQQNQATADPQAQNSPTPVWTDLQQIPQESKACSHDLESVSPKTNSPSPRSPRSVSSIVIPSKPFGDYARGYPSPSLVNRFIQGESPVKCPVITHPGGVAIEYRMPTPLSMPMPMTPKSASRSVSHSKGTPKGPSSRAKPSQYLSPSGDVSGIAEAHVQSPYNTITISIPHNIDNTAEL